MESQSLVLLALLSLLLLLAVPSASVYLSGSQYTQSLPGRLNLDQPQRRKECSEAPDHEVARI